jgi:3-dehydroquinate synthase II
MMRCQKISIKNKSIKKIIIKPILKTSSKSQEESIIEFINKVKDKIDLLYVEPSNNINKFLENTNIKTIFNSEKADYIIINNSQNETDNLSSNNKVTYSENKSSNIYNHTIKKIGIYKKIHSNNDIQQIKLLSEKGINFVIIDVDDWKIIPLENIIAMMQETNVEIFATARSVNEIETLFTVLELGVDGVIFETNDEEKIAKIKNIIENTNFNISSAKIVEIKDIGIGERVCIDTVSMLTEGEGMLIGNKSNFLFLIHNESIGSSFTSPRPFRVNAGAVHCYTITPDGTTKYLSELESGSQVLIVNTKGSARTVSVGRAKIETRPLRLFKALYENEIGSIVVQNAETIRFLDKNGKILPVTHAKLGDEILVYSKRATGRHFGMEVSNEFIIEK